MLSAECWVLSAECWMLALVRWRLKANTAAAGLMRPNADGVVMSHLCHPLGSPLSLWHSHSHSHPHPLSLSFTLSFCCSLSHTHIPSSCFFLSLPYSNFFLPLPFFLFLSLSAHSFSSIPLRSILFMSYPSCVPSSSLPSIWDMWRPGPAKPVSSGFQWVCSYLASSVVMLASQGARSERISGNIKTIFSLF